MANIKFINFQNIDKEISFQLQWSSKPIDRIELIPKGISGFFKL